METKTQVQLAIEEFCLKLNMDFYSIEKAESIIGKITDKGFDLSNKNNRRGAIIAAIYFAGIISGERRTQKNISDATNVSVATVGKWIKRIYTLLGIKYEGGWDLSHLHP